MNEKTITMNYSEYQYLMDTIKKLSDDKVFCAVGGIYSILDFLDFKDKEEMTKEIIETNIREHENNNKIYDIRNYKIYGLKFYRPKKYKGVK